MRKTSSCADKTSPYGSFWRLAAKPSILKQQPQQAPIAVVAARLIAKRWLLYSACTLVAIALQLLVVHLLNANSRAVMFIELIAAPLVNAVVIVYAGEDDLGTMPLCSQRVERILERAWAIILLDAGLTIVQWISFETMAMGDIGERLLGVTALFLSTTLLYSEPYAALENEVSPVAVVPFALMRSMMLGWVNVTRICTFFAIQLLVFAGSSALIVKGGSRSLDYAIVYSTITGAVLWVYFTVAYLRTLKEERAAFP